MFTWRMSGYVVMFLLLFLAGIATANIIFIYLSLTVLFFVVLALLLERPSGVSIKPDCSHKSAWDQDVITFRSSVLIDRGVGIVAVSDVLPDHFRLAEGNSFHVFAKGLKKLEETVEYKVVGTRRGSYQIEVGRVDVIHMSGLEQTKITNGTDKVDLIVRPRPATLHRMRDPRVLSQMPMPLGARSKIGMTTTDFREIRAYSHGDPYHSINWKATAKLPPSPDQLPLVNDFEKEGRKTVWVFLDAREWMRIGSTVENAFEYAVQAALGVSQFYLARNCNVGLSFFNNSETVLPETGKKQSYTIARRLIDVELCGQHGSPGTPISLTEATESCRGHMAGTNPFFIVITTINPGNSTDLAEGIRTMKRFGENGRVTPQVMVLHILGHDLAVADECDQACAALIDLHNLDSVKAIRRSGAFVVPWNPRSRSLLKVMTIGLKRRIKGA